MDQVVHNRRRKEDDMVEATPIQAQLAEAQRDRLRVLVVGAGWPA
jgi:hypothetical protein